MCVWGGGGGLLPLTVSNAQVQCARELGTVSLTVLYIAFTSLIYVVYLGGSTRDIMSLIYF